jgi:hypothetical protein
MVTPFSADQSFVATDASAWLAAIGTAEPTPFAAPLVVLAPSR